MTLINHMDKIWSSFLTWFADGLTSGVILTKIIELAWSWYTGISDRVKEKKDAIGQEFSKLYLEGKGHGFREPPQNQDDFIKVIYDIEKYDPRLSSKLAQCRSRWSYSGLRQDKAKAQAVQLNPEDLKFFEENRREAEKLADEVDKEIKAKWTI